MRGTLDRERSIPLSTVELDVERAVERRLAVPAPMPKHRRSPAVHFAPLIEEANADQRRRRRKLVVLSIVVHVALGIGVFLMPKRAETIDEPSLPMEIVFTAPVPEVRYVPPPPPARAEAPLPKPQPKPEPVKDLPAPVVEAPKPVLPEPPAPVVKVEPPKPKPVVKTGLLDEAPSAPLIAASRNSRSSIVLGTGFDGASGSASRAAKPGHVVEVATFDAAPAKGRTRRPDGASGSVQATSFDTEAAPRKTEPAPARTISVNDSDVEILSKPKPVYTEEARALRLEGDVVLSVVFEARGSVRVIGVASGLGHGLDEAAIEAAKKIQFHPAKRDGIPVDHEGKLRVVFRLA